jgi:PD-(D/E)XK nuclease superfamily
MVLNGSDEMEKFYQKKFYFSYSGLNKLLYSPALFYNHYVLNQREDSTDPHLVGGRVLHCLLFEPEKYDDYFMSLPGKLPSENPRKIIDNIFRIHIGYGNNSLILEDYSQDILTQLLTANLYQSLKTDQQRLEKVLTEENKVYFEFLKESLEKTVVDQPTLDGCKAQVEILKSNSDVRALLQLDKTEEDTHIETYNELHIKVDHDKLPFGFHGVLDNVVVDEQAKIIFVNDLKTTGKSVQDFPDSVEYYKYWIQAVIYSYLASDKFLKDKPDAASWQVKVTFIVIDKYNLVYPFQVSDESMRKWNDNFLDVVATAVWHYNNKRYDLPYDLAIGNVKL